MSWDRLEEVLVHVPTNVPPELRAFLAGVAEMEAGQGPRQIHVLDCVAEAIVLPRRRRPRHPTIEGEGDLVSAEECPKRRRYRRAVRSMRRRILGVVRRRAQRHPGRVSESRGV